MWDLQSLIRSRCLCPHLCSHRNNMRIELNAPYISQCATNTASFYMLDILNYFSFPKELLWSPLELQPRCVSQIPSLIASTITPSCCQLKFLCRGSYLVSSPPRGSCLEGECSLKSGAGTVWTAQFPLLREEVSSHNESCPWSGGTIVRN